MGRFDDAIALAEQTGGLADVAAVRRYASRSGVNVNFGQQVADGIGVFARAGFADGNLEPYEFTDIDRTASVGASVSGKRWGRPDDTFGIAGVVNGISGVHQAYLNAGGLGILVGDGALTYAPENVIETYYAFQLRKGLVMSADYQYLGNPAYNAVRGPVHVFSGRLRASF